MKKLLLLFILPAYLFSQSRENKTLLKFENTSSKITKAIGWEKNNENGKWIDNINVIDDDKSSIYSRSHQSQNFIWINISSVSHKEKKYYIIIFEKETGHYKYPSIYEDWQAYKGTYFFIITDDDYKKIKTEITAQSGDNITIKSKFFGSISSFYNVLGGSHAYTQENLLASITNELDEVKSKWATENEFIFNSQNINSDEVIRFLLPIGIPKYLKPMDEFYFEISKLEFQNKLLIF